MTHGAALLLAALPLIAPTEGPAAGEVLTLDQALTEALKNNRAVANANLQIQRAEKNVGAAKALRLPHLDLEVLAGRSATPVEVNFPGGALGSYPATGPIPGQDILIKSDTSNGAWINATLAQPLTQLHKIGLGVKLQEVTREIDRERLRAERATVANTVKRLYQAIVQTESALVVADERVTASRELLRVVSEHFERQTALASDRLDAQAALASHEYKALSLRNGLASQKERLNDLLGRDLKRDFSVVAIPDAPVEAEIDASIQRALARRPELKQARLQVDLADADRRFKKADYIPDLSLAVRYLTVVNVDLLPRNVTEIGLLLKWEPLDWGRRGKQVAEKALQLDQARNLARETENQVRIDVAERVRTLQESRLLLEAARLARESGREKLRVTQGRYKEQAALLNDVLQAQSALGDTSTQYDEALLAFWVAKADFERATGEDN